MNKRKINLLFMFLVIVILNTCLISANIIELDKNQYSVGEIVSIMIDQTYVRDNFRLEVMSDEFVYRYLYLTNDVIKFIPKIGGQYAVLIVDKDSNNLITTTLFEVIDFDYVEKPEIKEAGKGNKIQIISISVKDSKNRSLRKGAKLKKSNANMEILATFGSDQKKIDDVELIPGEAVKKIVFKNLEIDTDLELGLEEIDELTKQKINKSFKKLYAIDPSKLDFSEATVTSIAEGNELYKCKDWNFNEQKCYGTWKKIIDLNPGQEYSFSLTKNDPAFGESNPPSPHNVKGRILNSDGTTGVENGIPVLINNTNNSNTVLTQVYAPPIPPLKGSYSATINGSDNDNIIVRAWNSSHYGENTSLLQPTTTTINVVLKIIRPSETNVIIIDPTNNSARSLNDVFNVTAKIVIIGGQSAINCFARINISNEDVAVLYQDNYEHSLGDIGLGAYKTTTWNVSGTNPGLTNISVTSYCDSDGINFDNLNSYMVIDILIDDTIPPDITLTSPGNNNWTNNINLSLYYNATDLSDIKNCSLYFDNTLNLTDDNITSASLSSFLLNDTVEGSHNWFISCYDNSDNLNQGNSTVWSINVDLTAPEVSLMTPKDGSNVSNNTVIFEYNVTDNYGEIDNCSLILNDNVYETKYNIVGNITQNFTPTLFGGYHNWSIRCSDKANNFAYSEKWVINITDPDLVVYSTDIWFSIENPVESQEVWINATICNIGNENTTDVIARFFENEPYSNQIGSDISINLSIGDEITINTSWTSKIGTYDIYVVVDPPYETNGSVSELNESNNVANKTIFIPAYNIYYGKVRADILLDTVSNNSVFNWFNKTNINGNIYVVDTDSSISWTSLIAIAVNITYGSSMDDFAELDNGLGLDGLSDSIEDSYTKNGRIMANDSFMVYDNNITNIPILNSTNTSNFVTGILWDSNDLNPGEYNGSQDLVFITKVNQGKIGSYGIYDYEIKVPANLREYIVPNIENSITFYVELS